AGDMREALQISQVNWIGAHADPDLNLILISISEGPDQRLQIEGQIPHELMHLILFHTFPDGYNNLPSWLNEGLASYAELYPSPDYFILLQNAAEKDTFIPLGNLCKSFPQEPSQAYLAYAQSAGVVQYIFENYGKDKMMSLLEIYRQGLNCDAGLQTALGVNQDDLFRQWRSEKFGSAPVHRALGNFLPWALILLIALGVPVMISIRYLIRPTIIVKEEE
ncbi:MAG: peptidase MA family metallohydrolase, partial [Anaerolineales bacterium]